MRGWSLVSAKGLGAGRPGALDEARNLVALVSSLSEEGDSIEAEAVAKRLAVSPGEAEKLLALVLSSSPAEGSGLPLAEDGRAFTLIAGSGLRGRPLRLTRDETLAVVAAFERIGVSADDPIRRKLESSLAADPVDERLVRQLMAGVEGSGHLAETLGVLGHAIVHDLVVTFSYQKPGEPPERRRVAPSRIRCEEDVWYLDAHDLDREGTRTFCLYRMSETESHERNPSAAPKRGRACGTVRVVAITFDDERMLDLLPWHDLRVTSSPGERPVVAQTPYYGGCWLPRMIAACGGSASCSDPEVMALARSYAQEQLSALSAGMPS